MWDCGEESSACCCVAVPNNVVAALTFKSCVPSSFSLSRFSVEGHSFSVVSVALSSTFPVAFTFK